MRRRKIAGSGLALETCLGRVASQGASVHALLAYLESIAHAALLASLTR